MAVCSACGKDNAPQYKFCLGCGAELGKAGGPPKAQPMPQRVTDPAKPRTAPPVFDDMGPPEDPMTDPSIPALGGNGAAVAQTVPAGSRPCPSCGVMVAGNFRFCPNCGSAVEAAKPAQPTKLAVSPSQQQANGRLTVIRPDGTEGGTHTLQAGENPIGRRMGALFEADGYLSPVHAELVLNAAGLVVRDADSLNGVYAKISNEEELQDGDVFRIGQELLRFDVVPPPQPLDDGTEVLGSPNPGYWGRLAVIVGRDQDGSAFPLLGDAVMLGRERGDITFPEDGYVSGAHARVSTRDGRYYLADLQSSNGTFLRVRGEKVVPSGTFLLMGQQLFRVNF
jgi:pSer/pThr/pTyr-binding forkhead associated (FHA) protein